MKVWIIGQKSFGAEVFRRVAPLRGVLVVGVTAPKIDKLAATAAGLGMYRGDELHPVMVEAAGVDIIINAHGHAKIGTAVRKAATHGAIGYHPSLLPRHRGRSAVEWTIAMGDPIAGGTVYQLDDDWDTGPIIEQDWCHVDPNWTASDLWRERLFGMGVRLLCSAIEDVASDGVIVGMPQEDRFATYEPPYPRPVRRTTAPPTPGTPGP